MSGGRKPAPTELLEQHLALRSYLEALLGEVPDGDEAGDAAPEVQAGAGPPPEPESTPAAVVDPQESAAAWASDRFQCLLFGVGGLTLAMPLALLNGVIPWQEVTPLPNRSSQFLGLVRYQGQSVKVVDTALVVMPERVQRHELAPATERARHIILMGGGRWGLACDRIGDVLALDPADVRWRTTKGKRPWLAGTVLQHMCALIEPRALERLLATGEAQPPAGG
ncbi:MAG: CheW domain-containing protein [Gammaproteobacteria bacterium]